MRYIKLLVCIILIICLMIPLLLPSASAATKTEMSYFLEVIPPLATEEMRTSGILASLTVAQAIQESGYGTSEIAKRCNNLFGMKAFETSWTGRVYCRRNGTLYSNFSEAERILGTELYELYKNDFFRTYNSWIESVKDHTKLLTEKKRYAKVVGETDIETACRYIYEAGYCSDSTYPGKLMKIVNERNLTQYDIITGIERVDIGVETIVIEPNVSVKIRPSILPEKYNDVYISFQSEDEGIATVDKDGTITGVAQGVTVIKASTNNYKSDSCLVVVHNKGVDVHSGETTGAVNCRSVPNADGGAATVVGTFNDNTPLVIFGSVSDSWLNVYGYDHSGVLVGGYTSLRYIAVGEVLVGDTLAEPDEPTSEPSEEPSNEPSDDTILQPTDSKYMIGITKGKLNARTGPGTEHSLVGTFPKSGEVLLIGPPSENGWYLCYGYNEHGVLQKGYSGGSYIEIKGDVYQKCFTGYEDTETLYLSPALTSAAVKSISPNATVEIKRASGDYIGTGSVITLKYQNEVVKVQTVVVKGDINGNGLVDSSDYIRLRLSLLGVRSLSTYETMAAMITSNTVPGIDDYIALRLSILGAYEIPVR